MCTQPQVRELTLALFGDHLKGGLSGVGVMSKKSIREITLYRTEEEGRVEVLTIEDTGASFDFWVHDEASRVRISELVALFPEVAPPGLSSCFLDIEVH